jgi:hypothetical protein
MIDKANAQMVGIVAAAAFVTIFCLFAAKAAWSQNRYQAKVSTGKEKAHQQLEQNVKAFSTLLTAYKTFDDSATNVLGHNALGTGDNEGKNSKLILDALPSSYDFPALASSIEKVLAGQSLKVSSITGTDDQLNQEKNLSSVTPQPVSMPFTFSVSDANYASINKLFTKLQQSIRPIQIDTINLAGGNNSMTVTVNAHTYFQPAKSLEIKKRVVK